LDFHWNSLDTKKKEIKQASKQTSEKEYFYLKNWDKIRIVKADPKEKKIRRKLRREEKERKRSQKVTWKKKKKKKKRRRRRSRTHLFVLQFQVALLIDPWTLKPRTQALYLSLSISSFPASSFLASQFDSGLSSWSTPAPPLFPTPPIIGIDKLVCNLLM
jgi:hypothetical protein